MPCSLLYRFFRVGGLPASEKSALESEGLVMFDEGVGGSITYRHFRGHGKFFSWRRVWFTGSIAVTRQRFAAFAFRRRLINVGHLEPQRSKLELVVESQSALLIGFEAADFHTGYTGRIEIRFNTENAGALHKLLAAMADETKSALHDSANLNSIWFPGVTS